LNPAGVRSVRPHPTALGLVTGRVQINGGGESKMEIKTNVRAGLGTINLKPR
jgi:hypothetical protein